METAQCPARARGIASSNTSIEGVSQAMDSMLRHAKLFVHFHSFSCVATSSITRGTQPPKMNIRLPIMVAECKDLGSGAVAEICGLLHVIESTCKIQRSPRRHPLIPP